MARRRRARGAHAAALYPRYLDEQIALLDPEERVELERLRRLRSPEAYKAWAPLRRVAGSRFDEVGMRVAQVCLAHWPEKPELLKGPSPSETMKRIRDAVVQLERALKSPALDDLSTFDLLPATVVDALMATSIGTLDREGIIALLGDDAIAASLKRLVDASKDRFDNLYVGQQGTRVGRHGDSRDPAAEFALMLVDEISRTIGKPVYECAARLAHIVCGRGRISADQLRKSWQRKKQP